MDLQRLFLQGDLMISKRDGMHKMYDIAERVLPKNVNTKEPTPSELAEYLVETYLRAYGFTTIKQITHLKTGETLRRNINEVLNALLQDGTIQRVDMECFPSVFIPRDLVDMAAVKCHSNIKLLSPFDNSIIHRDRIKQFFNFDFRLECYTPKDRRQYGYFCLPILFGDRFIGRVDCKAYRKEKHVEIMHLHIENQNIDIELWIDPFIESIRRFATFNGCDSLKLTRVSPPKLSAILKRAIRENGPTADPHN